LDVETTRNEMDGTHSMHRDRHAYKILEGKPEETTLKT
jgi:hypothetical protein